MNRARKWSVAGPGNRLLPDHFQTALPMLPLDWAEKSLILPSRRIAVPEVLWCVLTRPLLHRYTCLVRSWTFFKRGKLSFYINFPRERRNIEMMTWDTGRVPFDQSFRKFRFKIEWNRKFTDNLVLFFPKFGNSRKFSVPFDHSCPGLASPGLEIEIQHDWSSSF